MAVKTISGGDKMEKVLQEIARKVAKAATVNVGFLAGATYPDGTSVPMVAAIQEFGAPSVGIPPRPYFRRMVSEKSGAWGDQVGRILKANDYDAAKTMELMGHDIKGQLQESIINTNGPPLSKVTLMLRKMRSEDQSLVVTGKVVGEAAARVAAGESTAGVSTKVLSDSGHLLNSVDYEVKS
jgi:hypothetical protein